MPAVRRGRRGRCGAGLLGAGRAPLHRHRREREPAAELVLFSRLVGVKGWSNRPGPVSDWAGGFGTFFLFVLFRETAGNPVERAGF